MAAQTIHRLKHPVALQFRQSDGSIRDESITELKLRRPAARDLRLVDSYGSQMVGMMIALIAALSGQEIEVIEKLDAEDFGDLSDVVSDFLPDGPKTGATG
ncbi:tail assembly chaperone E/41/14-like protein [Blastomonas natatoria]|uniref:Tail assembly chaperone E/41/14-like protein n=1 Tax=Blastomonas natatoria TaxID=34015 RepID=A0A2V3VR35_9SPHN|nr:phage tail assembly protein [Blastomonas natatoria]PXW78989.1 tail assembly chaperone E/41/14-like protein [Blastomonas natatoria]